MLDRIFIERGKRPSKAGTGLLYRLLRGRVGTRNFLAELKNSGENRFGAIGLHRLTPW